MTVKIIYNNGYGIGGYCNGEFSGTAGSVMCDVIKICLKRKGVRRMMMREMDNRRFFMTLSAVPIFCRQFRLLL